MKSILRKSNFTKAQYWPALITLLLPLSVSAGSTTDRHAVVYGKAVTGINELCGQPVSNLPVPQPLPATFRATSVGEYNPGHALPIPLTASNCIKSTILATTTDPNFLDPLGIPDVNPGLKNIPLNQNYVITGQDGSRTIVPSYNQAPGGGLGITRSNDDTPITLGQWLNAKGVLKIVCKGDGSATVDGRFTNLIPNAVYSMWGVWTAAAPNPPIAAIPLGGIPNGLVPDRHGNATFYRELSFCPKDTAPDGSVLMFITLAFHSDGSLNGANPEFGALPTKFTPLVGPSFTSTFVPGAVTQDAMQFPVNVEQ
jgi:hypothetical protein